MRVPYFDSEFGADAFLHEEVIITSSNKIGTHYQIRQTVWDAAVQKAKQEIMRQEDTEIFKVLDSIFVWNDASKSGNNDI